MSQKNLYRGTVIRLPRVVIHYGKLLTPIASSTQNFNLLTVRDGTRPAEKIKKLPLEGGSLKGGTSLLHCNQMADSGKIFEKLLGTRS